MRDSDDVRDGRSAAKRSDGTRRARATLAPYVPPAKRAKRGVTWAPASADCSRRARPSPAPATGPYSAQSVSGRSRGERGCSDHVKHPERYTCYTLDEPLIIGGGLSGNGSRAKARGVRGENEKSEEKTRRSAHGERRYGVGVPSTDPANARGGRETGTKTHSVSSVSDGGGGEAEAFGCGRRGGGDGDGARVFQRRTTTRTTKGGGEEDERVAGAGGVGRARGGSARGTERRFRRKVASEDEDA